MFPAKNDIYPNLHIGIGTNLMFQVCLKSVACPLLFLRNLPDVNKIQCWNQYWNYCSIISRQKCFTSDLFTRELV